MKQFLILLLSVSSIAASFLDIIPRRTVTEGEKVVVRCTEIFAYGLKSSSFITLRQNSSDITQDATWQLLEDDFSYNSGWRLPRAVNRSVEMDTLYILTFEFEADLQHNRMQITCLSSRTSAFRAPKKMFDVKKKPNVLSCTTNPSQLVDYRPITFRCWINLGSPHTVDVRLKEGRGMRKSRKRREFQSNTKFNYKVALYSWKITPNRIDEAAVFSLKLSNIVGNTVTAFRVEPKKKTKVVVRKAVVKDAPATLELDSRINLHVDDVIRCQVTNSTNTWNVKLFVNYDTSVNSTDMEISGTNEVQYNIPQAAERRLMKYSCVANSNSFDKLKSSILTKWIYQKNHRSFLTLNGKGSVFLTGSTAAVTCHFLPRSGGSPSMNVSILSREDEVRMKATFNGSLTDVVVDNLGDRSSMPNCRNEMNLFVCSFELTDIVSTDKGTKFRCETETSRRRDLLEKQIEVQMPPEIGMLTPSQIVGNEADNVSATCLIRLGYPPATKRSFRFDNMEAFTKPKEDPVIEDNSGFQWVVMRIAKILVHSDQGSRLTCSASNSIASASAVSEIILNLPVYNVTISPPINATLERNQSFTCTAYGYPLPTIYFNGRIRNSPFVASSGNVQKYFQSVTGSATIYPDDDFELTCVAKNTIEGRDHEVTKRARYRPAQVNDEISLL